MKLLTSRWTRLRSENERGSFTIFGAIVSVALLLGVGLVYDGGGQIRAQRGASRLAAEAARAAGQAVDPGGASTGLVGVDKSAARREAVRYLASQDVTGEVTFRGDRIVVTVHDSYAPTFLGGVGVGPIPVTGEAEAVLVQG